ncbi:MAG TPA: ABC transporter substrate-binding protein [Acidimicrobiaceae bacterium]|nr:ABC transporter substrate-binding protein [Acidimicrobiaceae bacterium]
MRCRTPLVLALFAALTAVGCGGADASVAMSGKSATSLPQEASTDPKRVVSISTVATEMLFAIGAGPQVVAVDSMSNFPVEAPVTDLSGYEPNVEAILGYEPDLVVLSYDPGDVVAALETAGVTTLMQGAASSIEESYAQIADLGTATGRAAEAVDLVTQMQAQIDSLTNSVVQRDNPLTYFHELDDNLFTVTSKTFIGEIYSLAGLINVADPADADGSSWGYPQLSAEYLLNADPDLIFLADTKCCAQNAATVITRPGWESLTAVRNNHIFELDDDVASRWGPRLVDFLRLIVDAVNSRK